MHGASKKDWEDRWQEGRIYFHNDQPNKRLLKYFSYLHVPPHSHCLVPLCGKSLDMPWLASKGQKITGIELSSIAIKDFFKENHLTPKNLPINEKLLSYSTESYSLIQGDLFDLQPSMIPKVDWIYDRAALVAIPPQDQKQYATHLSSFLSKGKKVFLISFEYDQKEMEGPPFSATEDSIHKFFSPMFSIQKLDKENALDQEPRFKGKGLTSLFVGVYILTKT